MQEEVADGSLRSFFLFFLQVLFVRSVVGSSDEVGIVSNRICGAVVVQQQSSKMR